MEGSRAFRKSKTKEIKMGWKSTVRGIQAAQRRANRDAKKRQRELEQRRKQIEKMQEAAIAAYEVEVFENYIDILQSIHQECEDEWNWEEVLNSQPPTKPEKSNRFEIAAQAEYDSYKPNFFARLTKPTKPIKQKLAAELEEAKKRDEQEYQEALEQFERDLADWPKVLEIAKKILANETDAYLEAITFIDPFSEINQLGSSLEFKIQGHIIEATIKVNGEEVIPSETKTLLKSGKISVKKMTQTKFYELYQDYVCGVVLRIARELFALLPIEMVIVTATGSLLNSQTGHMEEQPILSVAMPRKTLNSLNFDMIDPSDSMSNFVHRMDFKKTKGFTKVDKISPEDLQ